MRSGSGKGLPETAIGGIVSARIPCIIQSIFMAKIHTKQAAEAILCELPSVLGAYVREDINGHPREVHVLIGPGPDARLLAIDLRDLLEERLGIPVDQRVISIAQLAETHFLDQARSGNSDPAESVPRGRLRFDAVETQTREGMVVVRVRLARGEMVITGECSEVEVPQARLRGAAVATLNAAATAMGERIRLQLENLAIIRAFGREYALVTVLASAPRLGRRPLPLFGAQPIEDMGEQAAVFATLKAINRVIGLPDA